MKRQSIGCVFVIVFLWASTAAAAFFSESLIYTGPPKNGDLYEEGNHPTQVSFEESGQNSHASVGWWSMGGDLATVWDKDFQGWRYVFANMEKEFVVTSAGRATINFTFNGFLQVSGSMSQNGDYSLWTDVQFYDDTPDPENYEYWFKAIDAPGRLDVSETCTFNYDFTENNIGDMITVCMIFQTQAAPNIGVTPEFKEGESLSLTSAFQDSLKIDSMTGGIAAVDGPDLSNPVPLPSSFWIVGIALAMGFGIRKRL